MQAKSLAAIVMAATLAGCVSSGQVLGPASRPASRPVDTRPRIPVAGLEDIMGATRSALIARYGAPRLDIAEGPARKLQFAGEACILDTYLYARSGGSEPVVTHVDARLPTGQDTDRARCAAALSVR